MCSLHSPPPPAHLPGVPLLVFGFNVLFHIHQEDTAPAILIASLTAWRQFCASCWPPAMCSFVCLHHPNLRRDCFCTDRVSGDRSVSVDNGASQALLSALCVPGAARWSQGGLVVDRRRLLSCPQGTWGHGGKDTSGKGPWGLSGVVHHGRVAWVTCLEGQCRHCWLPDGGWGPQRPHGSSPLSLQLQEFQHLHPNTHARQNISVSKIKIINA